ncbi:YafY family transcriptional regulator [Paenibacillus sp. 1011MAR3C5]|uniref:helix-turn-helix transcriptional regulator n=1 Tax=Paenibacillus sp. 1011MAR3C5 TaxID=1675787 RepID=UPI000E6B92DD|nr:YafY family protein [Paenibacillus sp. 1011MAR3C5]RJE90311.1 YafY family transcriptional regulator [Paenibacillus sp. 1011MAR3C5]
MKRSDRLMAILIALQQKPATAQSLADKLEVSKRTIVRDMQSLAEIGIPLYAVSGPSGGYRLMEGYSLPPLHFSSKEALVILFALNAVIRLSDTPFHQARWTVMDKIRSTLPQSMLEQVEPVLDRLEIDIPDRPQRTPLLDRLLAHVAESVWILAHYRSEKQQRWLHIQPKRVYMAHGFWYCEAYSHEHGEQRSFRVDRFLELKPTQPPVSTASEPASTESGSIQAKQAPIAIHATLTYRGALLAEQDAHVGHYVRQIDDSEWELRFDCPAVERDWAVKFFYGMGMDATVVEPDELRRELHELGCKLADRYARN